MPVLLIDGKPMPESSDICHWLDQAYPEPALYPSDPAKRAKVQELEAWSDNQLVGVFGGGLFFQRVIKPFFLNMDGKEEMVQASLSTHVPNALNALENMLGEDGYLVGDLSVADFAISAWLRAGMLVGVTISAEQHPKLVSYLQRLFAIPAYATIIESENQLDLTQKIKDRYAASVIE